MYTHVLRRTGAILVAATLIGLGLVMYLSPEPGWQAVNSLYIIVPGVIALTAGGFLLRGRLNAAPIVRALAALGLGVTGIGLIGLAFVQPPDLTFTELRLEPASFLWPAVIAISILAIQFYVFTELGRAPIQAAIASTGPSRWDCAVAVRAGAAVGFLVMLLYWFTLHGTSASAATSLAMQELGPNYNYALTRLDRGSQNGRTMVSGVVTAWNGKEIKQVVLHWIEH